MDIVIFGYGIQGVHLYLKMQNEKKYNFICFADNSVYKQGMQVAGITIKSIEELIELKQERTFSVIIAANRWYEIGEQLEQNNISIEGVYIGEKVIPYERMSFDKLNLSAGITFYAGDICDEIHMKDPNLYGLSINKADAKHILHDITKRYPLPDNCIEAYQAEDVLEHIDVSKIVEVINEIYRILKPGGLFRICLPDYFSPCLQDISMKDKDGNIIFEPTGGGTYGKNGVENGGHVWFPNYHIMEELLEKTNFDTYDFLCYHTESGKLIKKEIDLKKGYINRIPSNQISDEKIFSIVIDCYK